MRNAVVTGSAGSKNVTAAVSSDLAESVSCLAGAFALDPITGFLLQTGPGYRERVTQLFSLLMRARIALGMPVFVARGSAGIQGAVMGYTTLRPAWPREIQEDWDRFEERIPGLTDRMAVYDQTSSLGQPEAAHYYLGVVGVDPESHGRGIGALLLRTFCESSVNDPLSDGVYLETAQPSNVGFYERAGFVETHRGRLGSARLWCMYLPHEPR